MSWYQTVAKAVAGTAKRSRSDHRSQYLVQIGTITAGGYCCVCFCWHIRSVNR